MILALVGADSAIRCDQWVERGGGVRTACGKPAVAVDTNAQVGRDPAYFCAEHLPAGEPGA